MPSSIFSLCALVTTTVLAAPAADKVLSLPGFGAPLSDTYSGYVSFGNAGDQKHLHYLFYASQNGDANAPVVFFFNGGPGCSSLEGGFQESGPLWTAPGGQGLQKNDYTWNKFAHHVFMEAPACVGFSYADRPVLGCIHNDNTTAADNLEAMKGFYTLFPEYANNDLWITGESYAGIYSPMLAYNIYNYNGGNPTTPIPLKGIMVGNGCIGSEAGVCGNSLYGDYLSMAQYHNHAFISDKAFEAAMTACGDFTKESPACLLALAEANGEVGDNVDVYDLYSDEWDTCDYARKMKSMKRTVHPQSFLGRILERQTASLKDNNCTSDNDLTTYLNLPAVQTALHVKAKTWEECGGIEYTSTEADERTIIYPTLIEKAGLQVVIFNGQSDACVPVTDNQWWTRSMGYPEKTKWASWTASDGSNGGYLTTYAPGGTGSFSFAVVRGAGHMVAQVQPLYAYDLAHAFIVGNGAESLLAGGAAQKKDL